MQPLSDDEVIRASKAFVIATRPRKGPDQWLKLANRKLVSKEQALREAKGIIQAMAMKA